MTVWAHRGGARTWIGPATDPASAAAFHQTLPGFRPTTLVPLPVLALELQVGQLLVKDESDRLGLNCGTVSAAAWPLVAGLDAGITVSDDDARAAAADLRLQGVDAGPCGAAALAGARVALVDPDRRAALGVGPSATVVLISTEGRQAC